MFAVPSLPLAAAMLSAMFYPLLELRSSVEGTLRVNVEVITLKHARAHLYDNTEGVSSRKKELRILLTDREVPASALYGTAFPPVWSMAMHGEVQGVLLELDPANPNNVNSILLQKPKQKGRSLSNTSISVTGGKVFQDWKYAAGRVSGVLKRGKEGAAAELGDPDFPTVSYSVKFDAAVDPGPRVTQDLKGAAALASPQVKALQLAADAMARADFAALKRLSTTRSAAELDEMIASSGAQAATIAKQSGSEMKALLKKVKRVVVRGDRATVLLPEGNSVNVSREGGVWKSGE